MVQSSQYNLFLKIYLERSEYRLNVETIIEIIKKAKIYPFFVFISGSTCSGKTYLANKLAQSLNDFLVISMDLYYKNYNDSTFPIFNGIPSFDLPEAYLLDELKNDLKVLSTGDSIELPLYDITQNKRISTNTVSSTKVIIIEGLYASLLTNIIPNHSQKISIFIESDPQKIFERRISRDISRGFNLDQAIQLYQSYIQPIYLKSINPQKNKADLIITNNFENNLSK